MDFGSIGQGFAPEPINPVDGDLHIVHLEADMVYAQPERLAVVSRLEF